LSPALPLPHISPLPLHDALPILRNFFVAGRTTLYGFYLFTELSQEPAGIGLSRLANLVADGRLTPHISVERPWKEIAQVAQDLMARRYPGKAVLNLD